MRGSLVILVKKGTAVESSINLTGTDGLEAPPFQVPPPLPTYHGWFAPRRPAWKYMLKMGILTTTVSILSAILLSQLVDVPDARAESMDAEPWIFAVVALVVAPPLETILMAFFFLIAGLSVKNPVRLGLLSALFWGAVHMTNSPVNAIIVVFPFYIMSRAYLAWRSNAFWKASGVTTGIHVIQNILPTALAIAASTSQEAQLTVRWCLSHLDYV